MSTLSTLKAASEPKQIGKYGGGPVYEFKVAEKTYYVNLVKDKSMSKATFVVFWRYVWIILFRSSFDRFCSVIGLVWGECDWLQYQVTPVFELDLGHISLRWRWSYPEKLCRLLLYLHQNPCGASILKICPAFWANVVFPWRYRPIKPVSSFWCELMVMKLIPTFGYSTNRWD